MAAKQPLLNFLPTALSLFSFILVLVVLLAGTNNALPNLYYLKTYTSSISIPSKLSSSTYLSDLSAVSGADYTGSPATASSLGLAESYTLLLLTSCAHFRTGVVCDKPRVGFAFNPGSDLRLDSTSLQGRFPPALTSALASYRRTSRLLADGYIASAALTVLAPLAALLARHRRAAGMAAAAAALSSLAAVLLLACSVAAVVTFRSLGAQINAAFGSSGLRSEVGVGPVALGFVAFLLALVASVIFVVRARSAAAAPRGRVVVMRGIGPAGYDAKTTTGTEGGVDRAGKPRVWERMPTWKNHRYVQVEKQPALLKTSTGAGSLEAVVVTSPAGTRTRAEGHDDDWAGGDEEVPGSEGGRGGRGIPMMSLGNKRERNVGSAYEPYSGGSHGGA